MEAIIPGEWYWYISFCVFAYQLMDNIDGKQVTEAFQSKSSLPNHSS
jgi:hypothetical protein